MIETLKKYFVKYKEIILYLIFGVLTTAVNWGVYTILVELVLRGLGEDARVNISNAVAWVAGVLFAYITNRKWVFESKAHEPKLVAREFVMFVGARALSGVVEIGGLPLLMKLGLNQPLFGVEGFLAKIVISVVVVIMNYVFSKLLVFRKKKDNEDINK